MNGPVDRNLHIRRKISIHEAYAANVLTDHTRPTA